MFSRKTTLIHNIAELKNINFYENIAFCTKMFIFLIFTEGVFCFLLFCIGVLFII